MKHLWKNPWKKSMKHPWNIYGKIHGKNPWNIHETSMDKSMEKIHETSMKHLWNIYGKIHEKSMDKSSWRIFGPSIAIHFFWISRMMQAVGWCRPGMPGSIPVAGWEWRYIVWWSQDFHVWYTQLNSNLSSPEACCFLNHWQWISYVGYIPYFQYIIVYPLPCHDIAKCQSWALRFLGIFWDDLLIYPLVI